jgi:3D (Asp-Asp-Asp) domain-containing protein
MSVPFVREELFAFVIHQPPTAIAPLNISEGRSFSAAPAISVPARIQSLAWPRSLYRTTWSRSPRRPPPCGDAARECMRRLILPGVLGLILASIAWGEEQSVLARVTVYWPGGNQRRVHANGEHLRNGHCAVDPKKIPYGSKVLFDDVTCTAVDTGPAVVSRKAARWSGRTRSERNAIVIDRFFETKQQAVAWSRTHPHFMRVRVQTPDSRPQGESTQLAAALSDEGNSRPNNRSILAALNPFGTGFGLDPALLASPLLWWARRRAAGSR